MIVRVSLCRVEKKSSLSESIDGEEREVIHRGVHFASANIRPERWCRRVPGTVGDRVEPDMETRTDIGSRSATITITGISVTRAQLHSPASSWDTQA